MSKSDCFYIITKMIEYNKNKIKKHLITLLYRIKNNVVLAVVHCRDVKPNQMSYLCIHFCNN